MKKFYTHLHVTLPTAKHQEIINKNQQLLGLSNRDPNVATPELLNFERAKLVPVDSLIQFTRGFAPCIWHDEKSPSMKHYRKNNKVHCFGCGKGGDVIDVVQQLKGCDVKEAVIYLTNGT